MSSCNPLYSIRYYVPCWGQTIAPDATLRHRQTIARGAIAATLAGGVAKALEPLVCSASPAASFCSFLPGLAALAAGMASIARDRISAHLALRNAGEAVDRFAASPIPDRSDAALIAQSDYGVHLLFNHPSYTENPTLIQKFDTGDQTLLSRTCKQPRPSPQILERLFRVVNWSQVQLLAALRKMSPAMLETAVQNEWVKKNQLDNDEKIDLLIARAEDPEASGALEQLGCRQAVVDEFSRPQHTPFTYSFKDLRKVPKLLKELIASRLASGKYDKYNHSLLQVEVYEGSISSFLDLWRNCQWSSQDKKKCLMHLVGVKRTDRRHRDAISIMDTLINDNLLKSDDFTEPADHIDLFAKAESKAAIELLKRASFDINAVSERSIAVPASRDTVPVRTTPLTARILRYASDDAVQIHWLLENGAQPQLSGFSLDPNQELSLPAGLSSSLIKKQPFTFALLKKHLQESSPEDEFKLPPPGRSDTRSRQVATALFSHSA